MKSNVTLVIWTITALITVTAGIITLYRSIPKTWKKSFKKGQTAVHKGLTVHRKNLDGYFLSIICQNDVKGKNQDFDVRNEAVSFQYTYSGKSRILTASINEYKNTIDVSIMRT